MAYLRLLRPKDWAKNLFLFLPLFFASAIRLDNLPVLLSVGYGFIAFCCIASSIYIINDYRDREDDRKHPVKKNRPLASGAVPAAHALIICGLLLVAGFGLAWFIRDKFLFVLAIYFAINLAYSLGLKSIAILDIILLAVGFVLRIKAGSVIAFVPLSEWIVIMVFLLALFMAIGKRRDDVLLKIGSGQDMRKSIKGYNLEFLNVLLALVCAVIIVAYFMYTMSEETMNRLQSYRLYYTCVFVIAGIMRYLQIVFVQADSGSPTKILYRDRFIQITILLWVASYIVILYLKDVTIFK
ncbi:MAG: decaprenyl-phosphate phosphoribosyltransferase [Bacteroidota bacterium]|nr:decaprenyl-phosphate phosphoribosyltransferase [Bacteroidota bacterium]MDP4215155.1 decaprenyl-phosphate phosphoribosyltransferase [Bacteroidota bacterium]MDP4246750.1 decaprenyl-phosphate phosphoribosyltransferase [Bacteroidota bacterium]MDP4255019.1 decaprenyl-phosphate phosphoribosyltransferase [Bacteroidota bacterium]MDP4258723.1 decaprenyl-phosphate phosphoribosyltransferase [Bacteroidota bacterium]